MLLVNQTHNQPQTQTNHHKSINPQPMIIGCNDEESENCEMKKRESWRVREEEREEAKGERGMERLGEHERKKG